MLIDVLTRVAANTGLHPVQQRGTLIELLNAAAQEMYDRLECNQIHREVTMVVPPNAIIAFPSFIGEFRGMRLSLSDYTLKNYPLSSPRYTNDTQSWKFKNWRNMGDRPIHTSLSSNGPLTIETTPETIPVNLLISGNAPSSNILEESLTLTTPPFLTVNAFGPEIFNIACISKDRLYDIIIKDSNGNEIAVLYNNQTSTRYKLTDVSQYPWPADTTLGESLVDVLYKKTLHKLYRDSDKFPAGDDYDNAWFYMSMYVFYNPIQNKQKQAGEMMGQALLCLTSTKGGTESHIEKTISFGPNKFYDLFKLRSYVDSEGNYDC